MEDALGLLWTHFALGFSALLPLVNPLGTALVIVGLIGLQPPSVYKFVARRVAVNTVLFLAVVELVGSYVLEFFGISMAIVQFAGGIVVMAIGWGVLNQKDADSAINDVNAQIAGELPERDTFAAKTFYPLTFPVTVGPGSIVVMLTLSAHASEKTITENVLAHLGVMLSVVVMGLLVYVCYAYAPGITRRVAPSTAHGIVRVVAFILLCIGAQIAWRGLEGLLTPLLHRG
jgi:multiple antibiotic resistance protein